MNKKKWMSILLCLMLVFTCITPVFADTATTWTAEDFTYGEEEFVYYTGSTDGLARTVTAWVIKGLSEAGQAKLDGGNTDLVLPAKDADGKTIQGVGKNAFYKKYFTSVVIPETELIDYSGKKIGDFFIGYAAFRYNNFETLVLPEGVTSLDTYAFANNTGLKSVKFPTTLQEIRSGVFNKTAVEFADFPNETVLPLYVDVQAFVGCKIKTVQLPTTLKKLNKWGFIQNTGMEAITSGTAAEKKGGVVYIYIDAPVSTGGLIESSVCHKIINGKDPAKVTSYESSLEFTEATYTGSAIEPAVAIEGLTAGTDFTVEYKDNINSGFAKALVSGKGSYYGSLELQFAINTKDVNDVKDKATLEFTEVEYTGGEFQPAVSIEGLVYGQDYTVAWDNNVNPGTATATVAGIGNYGGSFEMNFEIKKLQLDKSKTSLEYTEVEFEEGKAFEPKVTIEGLTEGTDYIVEYADNIKAGTAKVTVTGQGNYAGTVELEFTIEEPVVDIESHETKLVVDNKIVIPDALKDKYESAKEIEKDLKVVINQKTTLDKDDMSVEFMEITLMFSVDGGKTWLKADADNFPAEGIKVAIPYPQNVNPDTFDFTVAHLISSGDKVGEIEILKHKETKNGLEVTVYSLSPFAVAYAESEVPETGDNAPLGLMLGLMLAAAAGGYTVYRRNYTK